MSGGGAVGRGCDCFLSGGGAVGRGCDCFLSGGGAAGACDGLRVIGFGACSGGIVGTSGNIMPIYIYTRTLERERTKWTRGVLDLSKEQKSIDLSRTYNSTSNSGYGWYGHSVLLSIIVNVFPDSSSIA